VYRKTILCIVCCRQESGTLLAQVRSFGTRTRDLQALLRGERDPGELANLARGVLRKTFEQLKLALEENCTGHHRYLLGRRGRRRPGPR
jgi:hypothetical protein